MKVKVGESCFLLYECLGEIVSVGDRMVNEFDLLPPKPKGLVVFDPTRFLPDWKKQGRRTRLQFAKDILSVEPHFQSFSVPKRKGESK